MPGRLDGKTAIVTGAATGIGSATARLFLAEGARVFAADIKEPGDALAVRWRRTASACASTISMCGARRPGPPASPAARTSWASPTCLINNAGALGSGKPVHEETLDGMTAAFESNVLGMFLGMKTVVPGMIERGGGAIVNVSSVWGWSGVENNAAYQTSKGAAVMLSKNAGVTYAPHNIRVNCLLPGYIDTPMSRGVTEDEAKMLVDFTPLGRRAEPHEVAPMILFLASDEASFVAAGNYMVDGGMAAL